MPSKRHKQRKQFEEYVANCQQMAQILQAAIEDLEFRDGGGTLLFAVDYSEISAFAYLNEPEKGFFLFEEKPKSSDSKDNEIVSKDRQLRQLVMLNRIFNPEYGVILLPAYLAELQEGMQRNVDKLRNTVGQWLITLHAAQEKLSKSSEGNGETAIYAVLESSSADDKEKLDESSKAANLIIDQLRMSYIMMMKTDMQRNGVLQRYQKLNSDKVFTSIIDALLPNYDFDLAAMNRWYDETFAELYENQIDTTNPDLLQRRFTINQWYDLLKLKKKRIDDARANQFDAEALYMLDAINSDTSLHRKLDFRVVFVTRDTKIPIALDAAAKQGHAIKHRHPSIFNVYGIHPASSDSHLRSRMLEQLREKQKIVEDFLHFYPITDQALEDINWLQEFSTWINEIGKLWRSMEFIPTDIERKLIEVMNDSGNLDEKFAQVFIHIHNEGKTAELLPQLHFVQRRKIDSDQTDAITPPLHEQYPTSVQLSDIGALQANMRAQPYPLNLRSDQAKKQIETLLQNDNNEIILTKLLSDIHNIENRDERWLIIGYVYGLNNDWLLAKQFSEIALSLTSRTDELYPEILLHIALCNRRNPEKQPLEEYSSIIVTSLHQLDQAIQFRRKNGLEPDLRLIKEKATLVLGVQMQSLKAYKREALDFPSIEQGLAWLEEAEQVCRHAIQNGSKDQKYLLHQLLNNRLHFRLEKSIALSDTREQTINQLKTDYTILRDELSNDSIYPNHWSATFRDTLIWTEWNVLNLDQSECINRLREFRKQAQVGNELTESELDDIEEHLDKVTRNQRLFYADVQD